MGLTQRWEMASRQTQGQGSGTALWMAARTPGASLAPGVTQQTHNGYPAASAASGS